MRAIRQIILHCSDTPPTMDIGVKEIDRWHKEKGWSGCGYHYVVRIDGTIETGRPLHVIGAHTHGQNSDSIGICYAGGAGGTDTRNECQRDSLELLIQSLRVVFADADLLVFGHNDYSSKACPGFDAKLEYN